jgi:hypothetical protein
MNVIRFVIISACAIFLSACRQLPDADSLLGKIENSFARGDFKEVTQLTDSLKKICPGQIKVITKADSLNEIACRIKSDFSVPQDVFISQLKEKAGDFTTGEIESWGKKNWLENRIINGERMYFRRAASNLRLLKNFAYHRAYYDSLNSKEPEMIIRHENICSVIKASGNISHPVVPVEMIIEYSLTVDPDAVPEGETIRCWLPYPRQDQERQKNVRFISASAENYIIAPDSVTHRTIYMETEAVKGAPAEFKVSFSYQSSGQYFDPDRLEISPYDKNSDLYKKYTAEQLPDICFTEKVKNLADSITGPESRPFEVLKKLYFWIDANIPWAGALEYSIIPNIPEYVIMNRRGDCGMQTFLLMSMLRYKGIPVRWQSGWMMPPGNENLHDWCEVYFEGAGWIPVDMSYGLQYSDNIKIREFYMSGIDSYRFIVNEGVGGVLFPEKKYIRSEPFDFQRGEVEWTGGNLYFDKWDYSMKIEYLPVRRALDPAKEYQLTKQM